MQIRQIRGNRVIKGLDLRMNEGGHTWALNKPLKYVVTIHYSEDSCGFEHVFVGETKYGQEVMGLHNWVQFYLQEKHDHVDYKGYKARANKDTVRKYCVKILNSWVPFLLEQPIYIYIFFLLFYSQMKMTTSSTCSSVGKAW